MTSDISHIVHRRQEAIFAALRRNFTSLEDDLQADYSQRQKLRREENLSLHNKISELKAENARLHARQEDPQTVQHDEEVAKSASVPYVKYSDLADKYDQVQRDLRRHVEAYGKMKAKLRAQNETILKWQEYHDKRSPSRRRHLPEFKRVETLSPRSNQSGISRRPTEDAASDNDGDCAKAQNRPRPGDLISPESQILHALIQPDLGEDVGETGQSFDPTERLPSSQTTYEGVDADAGAIANFGPATTPGLPEDFPVVVSARSLKRKHSPRPRPSRFAVHEDSEDPRNPAKPIQIKEENYSSPLSVPKKPQRLAHLDSPDLDDAVQAAETPRKRKRLANLFERERSLSASMESKRRAPSRNSDLSNMSKATASPNVKIEEILDQPVAVEALPSLYEHGQDHMDEMLLSNPVPAILQPISVNRRAAPHSTERRAKTKPRKRAKRGAGAVHLLSEDGEEGLRSHQSVHSPGITNLQDTATTTPTTAIKTKTKAQPQRLQNLLEASPYIKDALTAFPARSPVPDKQLRGSANASPVGRVQNPAEDKGSEPVKRLIQSKHERLRARPWDRLGPDDFKINPNYNQGKDYAFTEVVRNREQKRCFPGCTRPECCGNQFRKVVELGGITPQRNRDLWSSSEDHQDDDQHLLEEFLGDDRNRLRLMSAAEKSELLLQAKTKVFADKHGKHRQAYERRSTPPGFWRTGFPTTQENERDREEAKAIERQRVEERYREAMRENGKWIFRDE